MGSTEMRRVDGNKSREGKSISKCINTARDFVSNRFRSRKLSAWEDEPEGGEIWNDKAESHTNRTALINFYLSTVVFAVNSN